MCLVGRRCSPTQASWSPGGGGGQHAQATRVPAWIQALALGAGPAPWTTDLVVSSQDHAPGDGAGPQSPTRWAPRDLSLPVTGQESFHVTQCG